MAKQGSFKKEVLTPEQRLQTKKENFTRVITPRMRRALKSIHLLRNCTSQNYAYSPEQAVAVINALLAAVSQIEAAFTKQIKSQAEFSLPS
jgi:hypothetical protein